MRSRKEKNEEIKETIQNRIEDIYQSGEYIYQAKELEEILNYIINLQQRIDEAIEFVESMEYCGLEDYFYDNKSEDPCGNDNTFNDSKNKLLDILKGDDTNE